MLPARDLQKDWSRPLAETGLMVSLKLRGDGDSELDGLGDIAKLGLRLAEARRLLVQLQ
jgi:hypothetical protein